MSKEDNGGPAFPSAFTAGESGEYWTEHTHGMTLRDYFAAKAMQGLLSDSDVASGKDFAKNVAVASYVYADAMLEARKK